MTKGMLCPQGLALATTGCFPQRKKLNYLKAVCHENQASHVERKGRDALQVTQTRPRAHRAEARRPHGPCCAIQAPGCPQVCATLVTALSEAPGRAVPQQ